MSKFIASLLNPVCLSPAGFFGQDSKLLKYIGAIFTKTITYNNTIGNAGNVFKAFDDGSYINRVGLTNNGLNHFVQKEINSLDKLEPLIVVSIFAKNCDELDDMISNLCEFCSDKISAIELNLSCPNISSNQINDVYFYTKRATMIANQYNIPISVKLPPDVRNIVNYAHQVEYAGADFISVSNTVPGVIKEENGDLFFGGVSGKNLKPMSQRCVYEVKKKVPEIAVVGIGGVSSLTDVDEYVNLGADAVGIVSAEIIAPGTASRIAGEWHKQHFGKDSIKQ